MYLAKAVNKSEGEGFALWYNKRAGLVYWGEQVGVTGLPKGGS